MKTKTFFFPVYIALVLFSTMAMAADSSSQNPAITGAGSIYPAPNAANKPSPESTYKIVFVLAGAAKSPDEISDGLEQLARTVNLYTSAGVPLDHIRFVGVITFNGTSMLINNKIYKKAYNVDNPSLKIINEMKEKGVKFFVDSQYISSLREKYSNLKDSDFDESIPRVQSAITTIVALEKKGYKQMMLPLFSNNVDPKTWDEIMNPRN